MDSKKWMKGYGDIIFALSILIVPIILLVIPYRIEVTSIVLKISLYIIYYIFAIWGIYGFYTAHKPSNYALVLCFISSIILAFKPLIFLSIIALVPLIFRRKYNLLTRVVCGLIMIPSLLLLFMGFLFSDFGNTEIIYTSSSPEGNIELEKVYYDQGALGADVDMILVKEFRIGARLTKPLRISNMGYNDSDVIDWLDDDMVKINGDLYRFWLD